MNIKVAAMREVFANMIEEDIMGEEEWSKWITS
jgi:hypothetical protein